MKNNGRWVCLCMTFAFAAPLGAEEIDNRAAISAAVNSASSDEALAMVRQAFAQLKPDQSAQAAALVESMLAAVPIESSGQLVVAAIEGNPELGKAILSAISSTSKTEQLAILSRLSFAAGRDPESFGSVAEFVPKLLNTADANVPVSARLTSPDYNPSNMLSETGVSMSPSHPGLPKLERELTRDELKLEIDRLKLEIDHLLHKGPGVIDKEKEQIQEEKQDIKEVKKEIRQDEK
jgi:hypothetical protein